MSVRKCQISLIKILVLLLPYHYLIFAVLLQNYPVLKLWRDLIMMIIIVLGMCSQKIILDLCSLIDGIFIVLTIVLIIVSPVPNQAINIARVYIIPLLMFHTVKKMNYKNSEISELLSLVFGNTIILSFYGIFQAYILGGDFLVSLGYGTAENGLGAEFFLSNFAGGVLVGGVQRVVSTFSSANVCSFYFCIVFIIFLFGEKYIRVRKRTRVCFLVLLAATIVLTFSRSCWLAMLIAVLLYARKPLIEVIKKRKGIVIVVVIAITVLVGTNKRIQNSLEHIINSSLSGTDTSLLSHNDSKNAARKKIEKSPYGFGLGINGPRALNYGSSNLVESSYYLMMFEYGIVGGIIYFWDYIYVIMLAVNNKKKNKVRNYLLTMTVFVLIAYINIPYIQEIECTVLYFISVGIVLKNSKGDMI